MAESRNVHIYLGSKGETWEHVRVRKLSGREAISELFHFDIDVACEPGHELPKEALVGEEVTIVIEVDQNEVRRIHGILHFIHDDLDPMERFASYALRVVPRAFRLSMVETQDIFLNQSVPDIIKSKLESHDFNPEEYEFRLLGDYPVRDFVVQYKESDLAFLKRLMEHVGVSFFFEHDGGCDKLVITDHQNGFPHLDESQKMHFRGGGEKLDVYALSVLTKMTPTNYIVQDYNYRSPLVDLSALSEIAEGNGGGVVEYGCHVKTPEEAELIAKVRAEEHACRQRVYEGKSTLFALASARRAVLLDHPRLSGPTPFLLVDISHEATIAVFSEDGTEEQGASYHNTFHAILAEVPFRPARRTPRPRIHGFLTGIIQPGSEGETGGVAELDPEGRYTVQFHFDTNQRGEEKASKAVRMAQPSAGPNYGMHFPLRRGTEVLVAFSGGDPDRPIIIGAVFNAVSPSPVDAKSANKHRLRSATGSLFEMSSKA